MAEVILPPIETEPELPEEQLPEVEKPTEQSKVISVDFNPLNTKQTASLDTRESFYTTDTDAWIVLNVGDMNEPTGQYSLALINKEDGSIFQRVGDIVQGVAYYKLLPNEIKHAGRWVGQAVITLPNGNTTASRFSFNVSGHILDGKDVREIVIQDFQTLMAQLNDLKDNATNEFSFLKNEIEAFQTTIQENEDERQAIELERVAAEMKREENYESKVTAAIVEADVVEKVDNKVAELTPTIQQVTAQLAQTEQELNARVSETIANAGDGTLPTEVVDMRTVGGKTYTVAGDALRAISDGKGLKDGAVTVKKTEYFDTTQKNYVNPETLNRGYLVNVVYGGLVANVGYNTSDFVAVSEGDAIYSNSKLNYALFNAEKVFVSGKQGNSYTLPIIIPSGVSFIQQSFATAENMPVISKGSLKLVPYDDVEVSVGNESVKKAILDVVSGDIEQKSPLKTITSVMSSIVLSDRKMNIKLLGDSITAGVGGTGYLLDGEVIYNTTLSNPNGHCWANSLGRYLESKYNCSVKNYGVSGLTSWALKAIMHLAIRPEDDIIICMIGTNDRTNTQDELYRNIKDVYQYVKSLGKEVFFVSCIPASVTNETGKAFHMEDVDSVVMKASNDLNQEYISLYKLFVDYCYSRNLEIDSFLKDGLHPNDAGYDVMYYLMCHALGIGQKRVGATW